MSDRFTCGRRGDMFAFGAGTEGEDEWRERRDPYHMSPTCSYCGSISPEAFFNAIEMGAEIGPTDKSYKVYVETPNAHADGMRVVGGSSGGDTPPDFGGDGSYWKRESEMTDDEFQLAKDCGWLVEQRRAAGRDSWICFGPAGPVAHGKFYFQHLDEEGENRFIELHNAGKINFGYPGRLYTRPYFAKKREPA